jgi:rhodanese-related sulfurtransferase
VRPPMVTELDPRELRGLLERREKVLLLDIREPWERDQALIQPSLFIPMEEVPDRLDEIPQDATVVVYCHHGMRSYVVADYLEQRGFPRVLSLQGGIDGWSTLVDPSVPHYG